MKNRKIRFGELMLILAYIFGLSVSSYMILVEIGAFSIREEDKLLKIKQCTQDGYGIKIQYTPVGRNFQNVSCCTKSELDCDISNLKK